MIVLTALRPSEELLTSATLTRSEEISELSQLHREAVGQIFTAKYWGTKALHNKEWDVFVVELSERLCDKLDRIHSKANGKAWKGFTSPEDGRYRRFNDYWIFGQLDVNDRDSMKKGETYTFKIWKSTRFESDKWMKKEYSLKVGFFYKISLEEESSESEED